MVTVLWALIQIVERPGDGPAKKQEVKEQVYKWLDMVRGNIPDWLYAFLTTGPFLDFLIDTIVWAANMYGFFQASTSKGGQSTAAGAGSLGT